MTGGAGPCTVRARGQSTGPHALPLAELALPHLLIDVDDSAVRRDADFGRLAVHVHVEGAAGGVAVGESQLRAAGGGAGEAVAQRVVAGSDRDDLPREA